MFGLHSNSTSSLIKSVKAVPMVCSVPRGLVVLLMENDIIGVVFESMISRCQKQRTISEIMYLVCPAFMDILINVILLISTTF